jgi:hypothetical protein
MRPRSLDELVLQLRLLAKEHPVVADDLADILTGMADHLQRLAGKA